jgi:hypothetical protein
MSNDGSDATSLQSFDHSMHCFWREGIHFHAMEKWTMNAPSMREVWPPTTFIHGGECVVRAELVDIARLSGAAIQT